MPDDERDKLKKLKANEKEGRDRKLDNLLNRSVLGTKMQVCNLYLPNHIDFWWILIYHVIADICVTEFLKSWNFFVCYFEEEVGAIPRSEINVKFSFHSVIVGRFQELLGRYILMEQYYMKESVAKAMLMEQRDRDSLTRFQLSSHVNNISRCVASEELCFKDLVRWTLPEFCES